MKGSTVEDIRREIEIRNYSSFEISLFRWRRITPELKIHLNECWIDGNSNFEVAFIDKIQKSFFKNENTSNHPNA